MSGGAIGGSTYAFLKYYLPQQANLNTNNCEKKEKEKQDIYIYKPTHTFPVVQNIVLNQQDTSNKQLGWPLLNQEKPRFGAIDPITAWLLSTAGGHFVSKGIEAVLGDINNNGLNTIETSSTTFERAKLKLEIAKNTTGHDQIEYVKEAEQKFVEASADFTLPYLKAECFKYAALSAKIAGRQQSTINQYANLALKYYEQANVNFDPNDTSDSDADILLGIAGAVVKAPLWMPLMSIWSVGDMFKIGREKSRDKLSNLVSNLVFGKKRHEKDQEFLRLYDKFKNSDLVAVCKKLRK